MVNREGDWTAATLSSLSAAASTDSPGSTFPPNPLYLWTILELQHLKHNPSFSTHIPFPNPRFLWPSSTLHMTGRGSANVPGWDPRILPCQT